MQENLRSNMSCRTVTAVPIPTTVNVVSIGARSGKTLGPLADFQLQHRKRLAVSKSRTGSADDEDDGSDEFFLGNLAAFQLQSAQDMKR